MNANLFKYSFLETLQVRKGQAVAALQTVAFPAHRNDVIVERQGSEAER